MYHLHFHCHCFLGGRGSCTTYFQIWLHFSLEGRLLLGCLKLGLFSDFLSPWKHSSFSSSHVLLRHPLPQLGCLDFFPSPVHSLQCIYADGPVFPCTQTADVISRNLICLECSNDRGKIILQQYLQMHSSQSPGQSLTTS